MVTVRFYYDVDVDKEEIEKNEVSEVDIIERARTLFNYDLQDRVVNVRELECEIIEEYDEWNSTEQIGKYDVCVLGMETYTVYAKSERDAIVKAMDKFMDDDMYCGTEEAYNVAEEDCEIVGFEGE